MTSEQTYMVAMGLIQLILFTVAVALGWYVWAQFRGRFWWRLAVAVSLILVQQVLLFLFFRRIVLAADLPVSLWWLTWTQYVPRVATAVMLIATFVAALRQKQQMWTGLVGRIAASLGQPEGNDRDDENAT